MTRHSESENVIDFDVFLSEMETVKILQSPWYKLFVPYDSQNHLLHIRRHLRHVYLPSMLIHTVIHLLYYIKSIILLGLKKR